jgi:Xaa-Pro aminopeptidase
MTVIRHGPQGGDRSIMIPSDDVMRGVERELSNAAFPSIAYTAHDDARSAVAVLSDYRRGRIGLVGKAQMSFAFGEYVTRELAGATFVDASDLVDRIKAVKSEEERQAIRSCARLQDTVMEAALAVVRPGIREREVVAEARRAAHALGSEQGVYLIGSAPRGQAPVLNPPHRQGRFLEDGDVVAILVECNGPGGYYAELGRMCVLGDVPGEVDEAFAFALEAQRFTIGLLRPGVAPGDVWEEYNAFMRANGRPEEARVHAHGQGYDYVERPLLRFDETLTIEAGMNVACHPTAVHHDTLSWVCDNWLVGGDGAGERLHAFPQRIVAI